jgi:hypothetical protein
MTRMPLSVKKRNHATVLVVLPGCRLEHLESDLMPFVNGLSAEGIKARLEPAQGPLSHTALYTGLPPDISGRFAPFCYDPEKSPFRWVRGVWPVSRITRPRPAWRPVQGLIRGMARRIKGADAADPQGIPPRFMPYFRPRGTAGRPVDQGALGVQSIFDVARIHGLRCRWDSGEGDDAYGFRELVRQLRDEAPYDLFVLEADAAARIGREHGPFSQQIEKEGLRMLDESIASVHAALSTAYDSWDLMVVSDQGVQQVERRVDVLDVLKRTGLRPVQDYIPFVMPGMMMLWYRSKMARQEIESTLDEEAGLQLVSDELRQALRVPMSREWGDRLVAACPGVAFTPSFDAKARPQDLGALGHLGVQGQPDTFAVLASSNQDVPAGGQQEGDLLDVFPTICDLLGMRVPEGHGGISFIKARRDLPLAHHPRTLAAAYERGLVIDV